MANPLIIVNNFYPIGYFASTGLDQVTQQGSDQYWASLEKSAPEQDWVEYDLGRIRPVNFIDFEISQKPVDFLIEYDNSGTWLPVEMSEMFPVTTSVSYAASLANPWHYFEMHWNLVLTQKIRITFTRREEPFPFSDSELFPFSIEIRNLRLMHVISSFADFTSDTGVDILGNSYVITGEELSANLTTDADATTYWQSQPNPSRNAVECLYYDLRTDPSPVTMEVLDELTMDDLDPRSMDDLETYRPNGVVVDEIFIDPVTFGPSMHIYYSNDDNAVWDYKLWTPIPREYILKRGYHALPSPTFCKYIKLEFTNLVAAPYNIVDYPSMPTIEYRRHPTWVQNYFHEQFLTHPDQTGLVNPVDRVSIDPLEFGFKRVEDYLHEGDLDTRRFPTQEETSGEIKDFLEQLAAGSETITPEQQAVENQIHFRPSFVWQQDLVNQLDENHSLSRVAKIGDTGWNAEFPPAVEEAPVLQSMPDLTVSEEEKKAPILWFPRRCRHEYQIVRADRPSKIAYFVAVREVSFHRRNYEVEFDEPFYIETLEDDSHILVNDLVQEDWRFVVEK